ncbi:MAG TPA: diiron oxygenase [Frankiaceae bacterium]|nr:diiron oxygenase [Frankiaceae bacterium]
MDSDEVPYRSAFRLWDTRAWVRSKDHQSTAFDGGRAFFSPDVVPLLAVPESAALSPNAVQDVCARHLQWHLAMTEALEIGPVNDAVLVIREHAAFPKELRRDALRLYTDEAGHAEMCAAMADAVERATGIAAPETVPPFVRLVAETVAAAPAEIRDAVRLLAAFVSETLISATLTRVPYDDRVQDGVRRLVADHAEDERRHAVLFRDVFARYWPSLDPGVRRAAGVLVPGLVHAFLAPDTDDLVAAAAAHPEAFPDPVAAAEAATARAGANGAYAAAAEPTLRVLHEHGAFDDADVAAAFVASGLFPEIGGAGLRTREAALTP